MVSAGFVDVLGDVRRMVAGLVSHDPADIRDHDLIFRDIGLDGVTMMQLLASVSSTYPALGGTTGTDERWRTDMSVAQLGRTVHSLLDTETEAPEAVPPGIERLPAIAEFTAELRITDTSHYFEPHEDVAGATIRIGGRELINYSSYNYLGTNGSPRIKAAVDAAVDTYGTSVSASRIICGEIPLHQRFEAELAEFIGVDEALVQIGGHSTNVNVIGHLFGHGDLILHDSLSHNSIVQGADASGAIASSFATTIPHYWRRTCNACATGLPTCSS